MVENLVSSKRQFTVSVSLCTHNGERFIGEQINSILHQTLPVDEIVLSDDASNDRTVELVEQAVDDLRQSTGIAPELIVLRNKTPLGVTKNFEQALLKTTGNLIALSDQDDIWHPDRIEKLVVAFDDPQVLFVFSNARQVDEKGNYLGHNLFQALAMSSRERRMVETGNAYKQFLRRNLATGATVLLRRELIDTAAPFPEPWLHDEWLAIVAAAFDGVRLLDETVTDYRQHSGNQVGMSPVRTRRKFRMFLEPRTDRNKRLFLRAQSLAESIGSFSAPKNHGVVPPQFMQMAHEKYVFEQARQAYPKAKFARIFPVLIQLIKGRYSNFGTGMKDAVRNIIQPV